MLELRENKEEIAQIVDRTLELLKQERGVNLLGNSSELPHMVYYFLRSTVEYVNSRKSEDEPYELNLFQIMDLGVAYNEEEDAEKEGNYVPYLRPGQEFKLLIKDDALTEQ